MDAIALLKEDHDKVKKLLTELETTTERGIKTRTELFATIKGELTVHEIIEEEIFYPELKAHPKARDIVLEGYEEHHVVDLLMSELESLDVSDEKWGAKAIVMKENIEHHIEEEEGEMFAKARQVFDRDELIDLGERMAARKLSAQRELNIPVYDSLTLVPGVRSVAGARGSACTLVACAEASRPCVAPTRQRRPANWRQPPASTSARSAAIRSRRSATPRRSTAPSPRSPRRRIVCSRRSASRSRKGPIAGSRAAPGSPDAPTARPMRDRREGVSA